VEAYLQESGRGGRDRQPASAILLFSDGDRSAVKGLENDVVKQRYSSLVAFAENTSVCRRESLLALLGAESDHCTGCDVCSKSVQEISRGERQIYEFLRAHSLKFTKKELCLILSGIYTPYTNENLFYKYGGFGSLHTWSLEEIDEGITGLINRGRVKEIEHWPWKGKLTIG
jgi:ATP-dependent DNA helicase RecQ